MPSKFIESEVDKQQFLASYDNFIFDCDGVLWHGSEILPGAGLFDRMIIIKFTFAAEVLQMLVAMKKRLIFVTNNSTLTRKQFCPKLKRLGIDVGEVCIFLRAILMLTGPSFYWGLCDDPHLKVVSTCF
jgi:4-nitrophenyl phosphatase